MLRSISFGRNYGAVRWNSVLTNLVGDVKAGKSIAQNEVEKALANKSFTASEIKDIHELLKSNVENDVANEVLYHGLPHDFSLYFTASKRPQSLTWNDRALEPLIKHNPGRVFNLIELLSKHGGESVGDAVRLVVVEKLLLGEKCDASETKFVPSNDNISKAISLLNEVGNLSRCEKSVDLLIEILGQKGAIPALSLLKIDGVYSWINSYKLSGEKDQKTFLALSQLIFAHEPSLLSKETLSKILAVGGAAANKESEQDTKDFVLEKQPPTTKEYFESVVKYIEENRLDLDKRDPEALLLRLQLMETYGIDKDDVDSALRKFHEYQTHEKFGIDLVQEKLVKAFCYQSFKAENETLMKIAETLINPEGLAVPTLAQIILAKCRFSSEKSLEIYNDYINRVSKSINEVTGRSPTGLLTEALMVANLYDNDREFAQLLYEKAVVNGIVSNEHEIALMKKVFKVYGDAFVEDDWKVAQPIFGQYVLECIKKT